jgi:hypothetical protein
MSVYDEVQKAIKLDIHYPEGRRELIKTDIELLPVGWQKMGLVYFTAVLALDGTIRRLYIDRGILKADAGSDDPITNEAIKWLTQQMAKVSSLSCIITPGKRAYRRKEYEGWPCIGGDRLIEYANEFDEKEREKNESEVKEVE